MISLCATCQWLAVKITIISCENGPSWSVALWFLFKLHTVLFKIIFIEIHNHILNKFINIGLPMTPGV